MLLGNKAFWAGVCVSVSIGVTAPTALAAAIAQIEVGPGNGLASGQLKVIGMPTMSSKQRLTGTNAKLDNTLVRINEKLATNNGNSAAADLSSVAPGAHIASRSLLGKPSIVVDVIANGNPAAARAQLESIGFQTTAVYKNDIGGWLPVDSINTAAALGGVRFMRASQMHLHTGAVNSQGDYVQKSLALRTNSLYTGVKGAGLTGAGLTVGLISDSFNCLGGESQDEKTNDLPGPQNPSNPNPVNVIQEDPINPNTNQCVSGTDEGRALAQIVYDVAPNAQLEFYSADVSEADFANGIITLATPKGQQGPGSYTGGGAQIIDDDVGYLDEPVYQDGIVGDAVNTVAQQFGTLYFSSAGNEGRDSYENTSPQFATSTTSTPDGPEQLLNMDPTGSTQTYYLPITIPPLAAGDSYFVILEWDQPYLTGVTNPTATSGSANELDICLADAQGNIQAQGCGGFSPLFTDPINGIIIGNGSNSASPATQASLVVGFQPGSNGYVPPLPKRVKIIIEDDGRGTEITQFITASPTIQGHPLAESAMAVGAAPYYRTPLCGNYSTASLELFSSAGGDPFLFDLHSGLPLATSFTPQKPQIVAPDRGDTTFFGGPLDGVYELAPQCQEYPNYPFSFAGTSAAGPHAAGVAALMLEAAAAAGVTVKNTDVYSAMEKSAMDMNTPGFDYDSGFGFLQADAAIAALLPAELTLSAPSFTFTSAGTQTETVTNSGTGPMTFSGIQVTPSGLTQTNNCPATIAAGASCTITLSLAAAGAGADQGTLSFATNAQGQGGAASVPISVPAQVTVAPQSVNLLAKQGGTASQAVTVTNSGVGMLSVSGVTVTPALVSQTNTCTAPLAAGATCTVTLALNTSSVGTGIGTLVIATNATNVAGGTASVAVSAIVNPNNGGGAFGPWLLLPGFALAGLRRRKRS